MDNITFKDQQIFYGSEKIGTYKQALSGRFIPSFAEKWAWIYYQFDFHDGENREEDFFKSKVIESITKVFDCFINQQIDGRNYRWVEQKEN